MGTLWTPLMCDAEVYLHPCIIFISQMWNEEDSKAAGVGVLLVLLKNKLFIHSIKNLSILVEHYESGL